MPLDLSPIAVFRAAALDPRCRASVASSTEPCVTIDGVEYKFVPGPMQLREPDEWLLGVAAFGSWPHAIVKGCDLARRVAAAVAADAATACSQLVSYGRFTPATAPNTFTRTL